MFILILSLVEILCGTNGRGLRERNKTRPAVHLWCLSYVFTMVPGAWDVALFICGPSCTVTTLLWPCSTLGSGQLNWQETWMPEESEGCGGVLWRVFYCWISPGLVCLLKEPLNDMLSSSERPQMVPPLSEDAAEDLRKAASALEAQALVEQKLRPADQGEVLNKVGSTFSLSL